MKLGPSLQGQLSYTSTRVHRPWQPGVITFLNLVAKNVARGPQSNIHEICKAVRAMRAETWHEASYGKTANIGQWGNGNADGGISISFFHFVFDHEVQESKARDDDIKQNVIGQKWLTP